jgi:signal transduction histidine kinase
MLKKNRFKINGNKKIGIKTIKRAVLRRLKSFRFWLFVVMGLVSVCPVIAANLLFQYYYRVSMIDDTIASLQTKAAVIAGEFSEYESLADAEKAGLYNSMVTYSALDAVRIRVIDTNFVIKSDSYSFETGRFLLNSRVINAYNSRKNYSAYDKSLGAIEAVVPIYSKTGELIGIFTADMDVSEIDYFQADVTDKTDVICISLVVLGMIISFLVTGVFGKSLKNELVTVEEVANGHTDKRLKEKGFTEFHDFARSFNLIMYKPNALDETRQEFVTNVSHELKTPITSIKVLADSLNLQENVPIELYQEFMQDIVNEIDRESKIIDDLLSLVRLDKSADSMNITSVNVNELLEIVLKRLKPIAQKKNIELLFESFRPVVAEIDEVKFTQVISNLVENAIKYNELDGWVHVSLNADYQYFYMRVEDSGIGIPKESRELIFERFYRVDKARSRETGGTGLGLAIVKNIILMHHGTIKMHSEEGVGTTFTVRIPLNYVE